MGKERIKYLVKFLVGGVLIFYVLRSKMIDFTLLRQVLVNPINLLVSLVFLAFSLFCCATRWYLLVRKQGLALSFKNLLTLTMIGNFFNTFMPGAVGGDLIKAWYVAGQEPQRKTKAIFTVLLDRLIGLSVIVFYAAVTVLIYSRWLGDRPELRAVAYSIWAFTGACLVFGAIFYIPGVWKLSITQRILNTLRRSQRLATIVDAALLYRQHSRTVAVALLLSGLSIFATTLLYSIQGASLGVETDLAHYFFVVPIGLTVSAIPMLPGGIGVGQVAFYSLFQWSGMANPEQGATLCTLMQAYTILFNCIGAFFYLRFKNQPAKTETSESLLKKVVGGISKHNTLAEAT